MTAPSVNTIAALLEVDAAARSVRTGDVIHRVATDGDAVGEVALFLYTTLHAGNRGIFAADAVLPDPEFEADIMDAVADPGVMVGVQPTERHLGLPHPDNVQIVDLERLRIAVPESDLDSTSDDGELRVRTACLRPNLSPGFCMYVHESDSNPSRAMPGQATRYYVRHEDGDRALADWAGCLERLTAEGLSFRTKILSRRSAYPRNDAIVFYAGQGDEKVRELVTATADGRTETSQGSPLCVAIGSGVSRAEDPHDPRPGYGGQSFGQHRCRLIAEAVVEVLDGGPPLADALTARCRVANVEAVDMARNRNDGAGPVDP